MFKPKSEFDGIDGRVALLGEKNRKAIFKTLSLKYPHINLDDFKELLPAKSKLSSLTTKVGNNELILCNGMPMFINLPPKYDTFIPTLYTCWRIKNILPILRTNENVPKFIFNGADLMLPGIMNTLDELIDANIDLDQYWSIVIDGDESAYAIGKILLSKAELISAVGKGKLCRIIHTLNDLLFKMIDNDIVYPSGFSSNGIAPKEACSRTELKNDEINDSSANQINNNIKSDELTSEETHDAMDDNLKVTEANENVLVTADVSEEIATAVFIVVLSNMLFNMQNNKKLPISFPEFYSNLLNKIKLVVAEDYDKLVQELKAFLKNNENHNNELDDNSSHSILEKSVDNTSFDEINNIDNDLDRLTPNSIRNIRIKHTKWKNFGDLLNYLKTQKYITVKDVQKEPHIIKININNRRIKYCARFSCLSEKIDSNHSNKQNDNYDVQKYEYKVYAVYKPIKDNHLFQTTDHNQIFFEEDIANKLRDYLNNIISSSSISVEKLNTDNIHKIDIAKIIGTDNSLRQLLCTPLTKPNEKLVFKVALNNYLHLGFNRLRILANKKISPDEIKSNNKKYTILNLDSHIVIKTKKVHGKYWRTIISGLANFKITDIKQLCTILQRKCAAGATSYIDEEAAGINKIAVMVQGNCVSECVELLANQYSIPSDLIVVNSKQKTY